MTLKTPVLLGIVGGAHGIRGEVRIKSFTEEPTAIGAYGPLSDAKGQRYTIVSARFQKTVVIARIREVTSREDAERLNGIELFVDRSVLPDDDEEDFYHSDLVGLSVETVDGEALGTVAAFHDFGAGDIVEIVPPRGASVMIPFTRAAVPDIDLDRGVMIVEPLAAGLVEAERDPEDRDADDDRPDGA